MAVRQIAVIGSRAHWPPLAADLVHQPELRVVAAAPGGDTIEPVLAWCAKHGHQPLIEEDWRKMLDRARPDMVVVSGAFELHAKMCIAAIERGIHVLTEKPAALTFEDLAALRQTHRKHPGVHLAGKMFSRYTPGFYTAARLIREGAIGDVRLINARKSYKLGKRPPYYHDRATYGGTIPWIGSHAIDWTMWFAGDAKFTSVAAGHSSDHNAGNGTMERSASCLFTLTGNRSATISIDFFRPQSAPTHGDDWARVVGTEGVIEVRPTALSLLNASSDGAFAAASCDKTLLRDFVDHVEGKGKALLDADSTLALADACLRARQAADEGRVVGFHEPAGNQKTPPQL